MCLQTLMQTHFSSNQSARIIANEPSDSDQSEDARLARWQQNRAAQDWVAIGRKILDQAEKSVTRNS